MRSSEPVVVDVRVCDGCGASAELSVSSCSGIVVDAGHQLAVGGAGGGELAVAFAELDAQVGSLLLELGDLAVERVDVCGRAEAGLLPGLLAEDLGQALLKLPDAGVEAGGAFVRGEEVSLQRGAGHGGTGCSATGWRAASNAWICSSRSRCR